jgi:hypothetical protein
LQDPLKGASLSARKITVDILDDINSSIQKYMFMLLTTNLLVALLSWIAFRWIGLENAGAWAAAAGLLHIIPYLGPCATAVATGMAAFMQFQSFAMAVMAAGASLAIATVVGTFVTTWMTGRIANLNPAAVFISLLFSGWLWGVWGMLLSIPNIRHRQGRFASCGAVASDGRAAGGLMHRAARSPPSLEGPPRAARLRSRQLLDRFPTVGLDSASRIASTISLSRDVGSQSNSRVTRDHEMSL